MDSMDYFLDVYIIYFQVTCKSYSASHFVFQQYCTNREVNQKLLHRDRNHSTEL